MQVPSLLNLLPTFYVFLLYLSFPGGSVGKSLPANAGDHRLDLWVRKILGEGKGNPPQYPCLGNPMDRGAWQATVHGAAKELDMT